MHVKPLPSLDTYIVRNHCKLIWESSSQPQPRVPVKQTVGFVAARVSYYENKRDVLPKEILKEVKISFDDHATTTFEYEPECEALKLYLEDHPDEREAAERQDEEVNGTTETVSVNLLDDKSHPPSEPETHMKSNTMLGTGGGGLISYKSKIQTQDFQFGMTSEPEITYNMPDREPHFQEEPDNLDLLPADDNDLHDFSSEAGKADMLF